MDANTMFIIWNTMGAKCLRFTSSIQKASMISAVGLFLITSAEPTFADGITCMKEAPGVTVCRDGAQNITKVDFSESIATSEISVFDAGNVPGNWGNHSSTVFELTEPDNPSYISDELLVNTAVDLQVLGTTHIFLSFLSDSETSFLPESSGKHFISMPETGSPQTASFVDHQTGIAFKLPFVVTVSSEVSETVPEPTPEPSTVLLLGSASLLLGTIRMITHRGRSNSSGRANPMRSKTK